MFEIGSRVRSFDFAVPGKEWGRDLEGERAAYVEGLFMGVVEKDGCPRADIYVVKDVFGGRQYFAGEGRVGEHVYPPMNGVPYGFSGEVCDSIEAAPLS